MCEVGRELCDHRASGYQAGIQSSPNMVDAVFLQVTVGDSGLGAGADSVVLEPTRCSVDFHSVTEQS